MSPLLVLVATAALGVEVGWEPLRDGGHEYTIQIEPQLLDVLKSGNEEIFSEVPPELNIRRYRIKVGTGQLPRDAGEPPVSNAPDPTQVDPAVPAGNQFDSLPPYEPDAAPEAAPTDAAQSEPDASDGLTLPAPPDDTSPSDWPPRDDPPSAGVSEDSLGAESAHGDMHAPAKLPPEGRASGPIEQAVFDAEADKADDGSSVETQKPELPDVPNRPWTVLVGSVVLLCCSLGANAYLGWIAWDARHRYRDTVAKLRVSSG